MTKILPREEPEKVSKNPKKVSEKTHKVSEKFTKVSEKSQKVAERISEKKSEKKIANKQCLSESSKAQQESKPKHGLAGRARQFPTPRSQPPKLEASL